MCTALFAFGGHPHLLFFLAFNRDEFFERPTAPAHWWEDEPDILAGRDLERKGTWLGLTCSGRFAFLTNFREVKYDVVVDGPSRGSLPVDFLKGKSSPLEYLQGINAKEQNGFNLVVGDLAAGRVAYLTNRDPLCTEPVEVSPGVHGLSNGVLSSKWPKVEKGMMMLQDILQDTSLQKATFPWCRVFEGVLRQCEKVEDATALPKTGLPEEVEHEFSSILIEPTLILGKPYGTRSQTVIAGWSDGTVEYREQTLHLPGEQKGNPHHVSFE